MFNYNNTLNYLILLFRYVILSYIVEFDKIHYPLPLNYEDNNDIETLRGTV
jgi:coiled-coil domain-containing protein 61